MAISCFYDIFISETFVTHLKLKESIVKDSNEKLFQREIRRFWIELLERELEGIVQIGFRMARTGKLSVQALNKELNSKVEPVIRKIVQLLDHEEFKNIDERNFLVIWETYWHFRNDSRSEGVSFTKFLSGLNSLG